MWPSSRRYLCFLLAVCFIINERESGGTAPCIIFRERSVRPWGWHHATGKAANLREKILWEVSVNTSALWFLRHQKKNHFQSAHGRQMWLFTGAALPASSLHSHAGLPSPCVRFVMMHIGMWSPFSEPLTFRLTGTLPRMHVHVFVQTWNENSASRLSCKVWIAVVCVSFSTLCVKGL